MKKEYKFEFKAEGIKEAFFYLAVTLVYTLLVMTVDKKHIGPLYTEVGFAKLNGAVAERFAYNALFDKITDVTMIIAILTAAGFAVFGLMQLIKNKSFAKVDKKIYGLAAVYIVVMVLYVFFDKVPLNYRPIIEPGKVVPEPSFPSTHTMVICTILSTAVVYWKKVSEGGKKLTACAKIIMVVAVVGRVLAGVHWITDIIGGLLISATITAFYRALFVEKAETKN
jgi:undecaprenyl-diphosphatase